MKITRLQQFFVVTMRHVVALMKRGDPVAQLDRIFIDDLPEDWDISGGPEEMILGVPEGTVLSLLHQIDEKKLWPALYKAAKRHPEQWMLDLSYFFPQEEQFVEPLVSFLMMSKGGHVRVCFAQDADEWAWGERTRHLLPTVIERVGQIREEIKGGKDYQLVVTPLDRAIKHLVELESRLRR